MIKFNPIPRQKPLCSLRDFYIFLKMFFQGKLIKGECVKEFEMGFAGVYGVKYALVLNSCRSGFALMLDALGIKKDDEVILPAFNLSAFPKILQLKGIKPVFIDVGQQTFNIDASKIEEHITKKTKAIVVVHLFGNTCDMDSIMAIAKKYNLRVIEDCANAYQTKYKNRIVGTFGDLACFSLGHSKDVPTFGGGIVITNNAELYKKVHLRYHKEYDFPTVSSMVKLCMKNVFLKISTSKFIFLLFVYPMMILFRLFKIDIVGHFIEENDQKIHFISQERFTNFQACIGLAKLKQNNMMQKKRLCIAQRFNKSLLDAQNIKITKVIKGGSHAYWNYPILTSDRERLLKYFLWRGIDARAVDNYDCNEYKIFKEFKSDCPCSKGVSKTMLTLPIYHYMSEGEIEFIIKSIQKKVV